MHDLITMGRVGVDLYPEQIGVPLAEVETFAKSLGGSATNVAVAAARLGLRSAVITKVGDDPFGPYVRERAARRSGSTTRFVGTHPSLRTPVVFCEIHPPDDFPLLFYREPQAPDMTLAADELDFDAIRAARVFWTTGTGLSAEPSREATLAALAAREGGITVHDLDHRPMFWPDESEAGHWARAALRHATVAVGNRDEVAVAVRTRDPYAASAALLELGVELAVVKRGPEGVLARTRDELVEVEPVPVEVVNGLGAGDAFGGALVYGLLSEWPLERTIRLANAAGAFVAGAARVRGRDAVAGRHRAAGGADMRLTVAQALVRFLAAQEIERDGERRRFFAGCFGIFGHGNLAGLGQALHQHQDLLPYHQARNEQAMVHLAAGYARQRNRLGAYACTTSIGPGATNMVTGAALATINRLPVLLLPGDTFATRAPHPVLQQLEAPHDATCRSTTASSRCRATSTASSGPSSSCPRRSRRCGC